MLGFDGYTDLERIGHGGLGDVYRATRTSTGGTVAIKVLRDVSDESVAWNRTRRELTALVSLGGHAHVIQLVELLEQTPGLVMEYAPGGSVAQLLDRRGTTLDTGEIVLIGRQTASALIAAHEQGIVHRDVKPQNLLIDAFGQVKLCDFGIASLARTEEFRTRTSAISMRYASPEDLEDDAEVGPRADVYSLGATLLHLAHGAPPTLKERLAPWTPPPTDDPARGVLDRLLADCLQPDPAARPTATEVLDRLDELDRELPDRRRALAVPPTPPDGPAEAAATDGPAIDAPSTDGPAADGQAAEDVISPAAPIEPADLVELADDPTLYRTGRVPPSPVRPAPPTRRRRPARTMVAGGAVVAAVIAGVVLLSGREADAPVPPTTTAPDGTTVAPTGSDRLVIVERPEGLIALDDPTLVWPLGAIGECLVQLDGVDTLRPVECDEPHDLQRVAVGALDETATSPDQPDDAELELAVADLCLEAAPELALPELRIAQTNPSAATWRDGDRGYQCLLGVPDARLTGSALD
jgi:eukaryotic-like serine/threonine-protein kinase